MPLPVSILTQKYEEQQFKNIIINIMLLTLQLTILSPFPSTHPVFHLLLRYFPKLPMLHLASYHKTLHKLIIIFSRTDEMMIRFHINKKTSNIPFFRSATSTIDLFSQIASNSTLNCSFLLLIFYNQPTIISSCFVFGPCFHTCFLTRFVPTVQELLSLKLLCGGCV